MKYNGQGFVLNITDKWAANFVTLDCSLYNYGEYGTISLLVDNNFNDTSWLKELSIIKYCRQNRLKISIKYNCIYIHKFKHLYEIQQIISDLYLKLANDTYKRVNLSSGIEWNKVTNAYNEDQLKRIQHKYKEYIDIVTKINDE